MHHRIRLRNFSPRHSATTPFRTSYLLKVDFSDRSTVASANLSTTTVTAAQNIDQQAQRKLESVCKPDDSIHGNSILTVGELTEQLKWGIRPSAVDGSSSPTVVTVGQLVEQLRIGIKRLRKADEIKDRASIPATRLTANQDGEQSKLKIVGLIKNNGPLGKRSSPANHPIKLVTTLEKKNQVPNAADATSSSSKSLKNNRSPSKVVQPSSLPVKKLLVASIPIRTNEITSCPTKSNEVAKVIENDGGSTDVGLQVSVIDDLIKEVKPAAVYDTKNLSSSSGAIKSINQVTTTNSSGRDQSSTGNATSVVVAEGQAIKSVIIRKKIKPVRKSTVAQLFGRLKEEMKILLGDSITTNGKSSTIGEIIGRLEGLTCPKDSKDYSTSLPRECSSAIEIEKKRKNHINKLGVIANNKASQSSVGIAPSVSLKTLQQEQDTHELHSVSDVVEDASVSASESTTPLKNMSSKQIKKVKIASKEQLLNEITIEKRHQAQLKKFIQDIFPGKGDCDIQLFNEFIEKKLNVCNSSNIALFMRIAGNKSKGSNSVLILRENLPAIALRLSVISESSWLVSHISNIFFGLQYYNENDEGFQEIIFIMTKILDKTVKMGETIPFEYVPNIFYGLQKNKYQSKESKKFLTVITRIIGGGKEEEKGKGNVTATELGNTLMNFQELTSDVIEVQDLLLVMTERIKSCTEPLENRNVSNTLCGLKRMNSDHINVLALLSALTEKILIGQKEVRSNVIGFSLYGLQRMNSNSQEVRDLLSALTAKIQICETVFQPQAVSNALYGLQRMTSDCAEVRALLSALTPKIESCTEPFTAQQMSDAIYGLQGMKSDSVEVHTLLSVLVRMVQSCTEIPNKLQLSNAMFALQGMDGSHIDVVSMRLFLQQHACNDSQILDTTEQ